MKIRYVKTKLIWGIAYYKIIFLFFLLISDNSTELIQSSDEDDVASCHSYDIPIFSDATIKFSQQGNATIVFSSMVTVEIENKTN